MSAVFLDTGYLIAIEAADDQNHAAADQHWNIIHRLHFLRPDAAAGHHRSPDVRSAFCPSGFSKTALSTLACEGSCTVRTIVVALQHGRNNLGKDTSSTNSRESNSR
jgi:hypothetical protein